MEHLLPMPYLPRSKKETDGDLIAPVKMEDNYFMLLPGEQRTLTATYNLSDLGDATPVVEVDSYNNATSKNDPRPTTENLAAGKTATASSTQGSNTASRALETSMYTKWQSSTNANTGADPQWFKVDFGEPTIFDRAIIGWDYANYAQDMIIEGSDDDENWVPIYNSKNSNGSSVSDLQFTPVKKRYIRLTMSGKRPGGPQIGPGGTGNGVIGLDAAPASTSFNIASLEVYAPSISTVVGMNKLVEQFEKESKISNSQVAHSLKLHLTAVALYEKQNATEKVVKHMEGFKLLLDQHKAKEFITDQAYNRLKAGADSLIVTWQ